MTNGDECKSKYRSYRAEDNTYQPFDDGPRRPCESALVLSHAMTQSEQSVADNFDQSHVSWCRARDSSHVSGHTLDGRLASQPSAAFDPLGRCGIECKALRSLASDRLE
jgi:hypothetical protein